MGSVPTPTADACRGGGHARQEGCHRSHRDRAGCALGRGHRVLDGGRPRLSRLATSVPSPDLRCPGAEQFETAGKHSPRGRRLQYAQLLTARRGGSIRPSGEGSSVSVRACLSSRNVRLTVRARLRSVSTHLDDHSQEGVSRDGGVRLATGSSWHDSRTGVVPRRPGAPGVSGSTPGRCRRRGDLRDADQSNFRSPRASDRRLAGEGEGGRRHGSGFQACGRDPASRPVAKGGR
jgi:hypothetical protein